MVEGNLVSGTWRRAADHVAKGPVLDQHAEFGIAQIQQPGRIGADEVAHDGCAGGGRCSSKIPLPLLPAITFPSPAPVPPIRLPVAELEFSRIPSPPLPMMVIPSAPTPIRLPWMTLLGLAAGSNRIPSAALSAMTLFRIWVLGSRPQLDAVIIIFQSNQST